MDSAEAPPNLRERQKAQTHELIVDAMVEAFARGDLERITHDAMAKRTGVSRQTVYRHFPDREALMKGAVGGALNWPHGRGDAADHRRPELTEKLLPDLFASFDRNADLITITQSDA